MSSVTSCYLQQDHHCNVYICKNSHDMRAIRGVSGSETRSTDRLPRPTETRGQMLNFTAEAGSNPGDK